MNPSDSSFRLHPSSLFIEERCMSIKILFADDDPSMRQIIKMTLELRGRAMGVEVLTVPNGEAAVKAVKEDEGIDIVLLD